jgi:hypothetical protein
VPLQALYAGLVLIVPDLDESVVGARDDVGLVAAVVVVDAVHTLLVTLEGKVGAGGAELPNLQDELRLFEILYWIEKDEVSFS